jgi:excinuclease ABC subunit C
MIKKIRDVDWIVVSSEVEALLTEANLIKKYQPFYNVNLRDDKSFPYIRITKEPYPRVFITRTIVKDGSRYFGPYTDVIYLRRTLKAIRAIFPIRSCDFFIDDDVIEKKKISLCLDYHIKKCEGPCEGMVSEQIYGEMISNVIKFLNGRTNDIENSITEKMNNASHDLRFEDAGVFRDQLTAIKDFRERQRKVSADFKDRDIFALATDEDYGIAVVVRIRNGRINSREKLSLRNLDSSEESIFETILTRFYLESDFIPNEIVLPKEPTNSDQLIAFLKQKRKGSVKFKYAERGEKAKELRLAYQNAKLLLGEWKLNRMKRKDFVPKMVEQLKEDLQLKSSPRKIEAFDISHLGGTNTVASMVSFFDGKPKKNEYRKYNIKTVEGIDDFASMREVVFRRYSRVKKEGLGFPDLILIDGGKGQLSMAVSALRELGLEYITVIGIAKRLEEVFVPGHSDPQNIPKSSSGLILLRRIRDEAHRFAITFQRTKRKKTSLKSVFDDIAGMGPSRVKKIMKDFNGIDEIASLDPKAIKEKSGIPISIAKEVVRIAKKTNLA